MKRKMFAIALTVSATMMSLFCLAPAATAQTNEKVLYIFTGGQDGGYPAAGLTWDSSGNLYGITSDWSLSSAGHVFRLTADGNGNLMRAKTNLDNSVLKAELLDKGNKDAT